MNLHNHARLTPRGRALLVGRVLDEGLRVEEAAQAAGVSVRTAYKWLARFRDEGTAGLLDRTSRPRSCPHATPEAVVGQLVEHRQQRLTYRQIADELQLAASTVGRLLRRAGLNRLSELEPRPVPRRYEYATPGDMLHLDIKKLGRFWRPGHRVTGDRQRASDGAGWDFVHVAIDDASRVAHGCVLPDERGTSACKALLGSLRHYRSLGVRFTRVMTDNGACYRSRSFRRLLRRLGLRHIRTRPYTPQTNGKAERFIQTSLREWAYAAPYQSSIERNRAMPGWIDAYNTTRPHSALNGIPPFKRLNNLLGNDS